MKARLKNLRLKTQDSNVMGLCSRLFLGFSLFILVSCGDGGQNRFPDYDGTAERDAFWSYFNDQMLKRLQAQEKGLTEKITAEADEEKRAELQVELNKVQHRLGNPEFFTFASLSDLPSDLVWQDGMDEPEIGDPDAQKGGTFTFWMPSFPPTIRPMGENANNAFRGYHYDDVDLSLVGLHPETGKVIPGIAVQWAESADLRTVYFRIDPDATYSDGVPVEVDDFFNTFYMQLSEYSQNPFGNEWYATQYTNITRYDERTLSITLAEPKVLAPYWVSMAPMPRHFYAEFGPDYEARYQWRTRPIAGAYVIQEGDVQFGRAIKLSRVKDWWARDKKYYKHRFNPDYLIYRVVRLPDKALELHFQGTIDAFYIGQPQHWYERLEIPQVHQGYIEKSKFFNQWPSAMIGLYLNTAKPPLDNRDIRIGISHAVNYQKVIDFDLRGDFRRLNAFSEGYPLLGDPPIRAREFSPQKAREQFAKAGYVTTDRDGILKNANGERLSVTITHRRAPLTDKYMQRIREEGLKCGIEFKLESMDGTAGFQKASQKEHQIFQAAWGSSPPFPDHFQFCHSSTAFEADGETVKRNTNNFFSLANPQMDDFCEIQRKATSIEMFRKAVFGADQIIHDEAVWVPGFEQNFYWVSYWRWVKWPPNFNVTVSQDPFQSYVLWIDEDARKETLEAMRSGQAFPEVDRVYNQRRSGDAKEAQP